MERSEVRIRIADDLLGLALSAALALEAILPGDLCVPVGITVLARIK